MHLPVAGTNGGGGGDDVDVVDGEKRSGDLDLPHNKKGPKPKGHICHRLLSGDVYWHLLAGGRGIHNNTPRPHTIYREGEIDVKNEREHIHRRECEADVMCECWVSAASCVRVRGHRKIIINIHNIRQSLFWWASISSSMANHPSKF